MSLEMCCPCEKLFFLWIFDFGENHEGRIIVGVHWRLRKWHIQLANLVAFHIDVLVLMLLRELEGGAGEVFRCPFMYVLVPFSIPI